MSKKMVTIQRIEDIPEFKTEVEEAVFWENHEFGAAMLAKEPDPDFIQSIKRSQKRPATTQISLKLEQDLKERLEAVAKAKNMPYQSLLKSFVAERLYEEEKRLGIIS
jgi:hypothetical protein